MSNRKTRRNKRVTPISDVEVWFSKHKFLFERAKSEETTEYPYSVLRRQLIMLFKSEFLGKYINKLNNFLDTEIDFSERTA